MKTRYGSGMTYGHRLPGATRLSRLSTLSPAARNRLKWMDYYSRCGNARLTCRHFGISPDVFYRWRRRFNPGDLTSLEDDTASRRPKRVRRPETDPHIVARIKSLRETYPRWGKKKLHRLLEKEGMSVSVSTVGRTLHRLRVRRILTEPPAVLRVLAKKRRKKTGKRPHATRKPWNYRPTTPGDLIQVDTVHVHPLPGENRYQFTAQDVISKQTVRRAARTITATSASSILTALTEALPFPVKAIQIDGGSEFKGVFETTCAALGYQLFVLPIKSPKLNGVVERMQRTSREEIYDILDVPLDITQHNQLLQAQDYIYNHIRPHDSLDLLTPQEYCDTHLT
jgi:putative transposase